MNEVKSGGMKIAKAAEFLDLSEHTLRDMADRGEIPCHRLNRQRYFSVDELKRWIISREDWVKRGQDQKAS